MYYYNSETKQSSWEKPDDLKSPVEVLDIILICTLNYTSQVYDVFFFIFHCGTLVLSVSSLLTHFLTAVLSCLWHLKWNLLNLYRHMSDGLSVILCHVSCCCPSVRGKSTRQNLEKCISTTVLRKNHAGPNLRILKICRVCSDSSQSF